jgi:hypothetical protein
MSRQKNRYIYEPASTDNAARDGYNRGEKEKLSGPLGLAHLAQSRVRDRW